MFKFIISFFLIVLFISASSAASDLKEYCDNDPIGELYSELWDAPLVEDAFVIVGLNPIDYKEIIASFDGDSIFALARDYKDTYPEIWAAVRIWKLETCIAKGYEALKVYF